MQSISRANLSEMEHRLSIVLTEEQRQQIEKKGCIITFPKKRLILRYGDSSKNLYFILKGLVRGYYIDEQGEEVTKCFSYEGGFFCSEGFRGRKESSFYIETLEESVCIALPYELMRELMRKDTRLHLSIEKLLFKEIERLEERSRQMMLMDAEARYLTFQKEYPGLEGRIKKQYIASYIGIQPGSLSRIIKNSSNFI